MRGVDLQWDLELESEDSEEVEEREERFKDMGDLEGKGKCKGVSGERREYKFFFIFMNIINPMEDTVETQWCRLYLRRLMLIFFVVFMRFFFSIGQRMNYRKSVVSTLSSGVLVKSRGRRTKQLNKKDYGK